MSSFQLLDPREEDELHKLRLLNVEEKPFKRITKRLLTPGSLLQAPSKLPTPPPDLAPENATSQDAEQQKQLEDYRQFREDVLLDFAAFDSSISRIQFVRKSNQRECERYRMDKQRILDTAQAVRENTAQLRIQLEEAKAKLEQRKKFDELAEKITNSKMLKPREDQEVHLKKLEEECRELERESRAYGETWKERKAQFEKIVEEGMQLRRLIRDEKEEVERREGMDGGEEDGEAGEGSRGGQTPKHMLSENATPGPDGGHSDAGEGLKPRPYSNGLSRSGSRATSRAPSPAVSERRRLVDLSDESEQRGFAERTTEAVVDDDAMMAEPGARITETDTAVDTPMADMEPETPQVIIDEPVEDTVEEVEAGEKMDTT